jgi:hypothetical protein
VVIVKGGDSANIYTYDPEAMSGTGLHAPTNPSGGPAALSHITFCYDWELNVSKTALPSFKRTWSWTIDKSSSTTALTLSQGQIMNVGYSVALTSSFVDSDWAVAGQITVHNPSPHVAMVNGVVDSLPDGMITVTCGDADFPFTLAPGASLVCTYMSPLPNATTRMNEAQAATDADSWVGPGSGTASVDFANATITKVDECIQVSDNKAGSLGQVCADEAPKTFMYTSSVGPYATCGDYTFDNTASFLAPSGAVGSDMVSIPVQVAFSGCTLGMGYWKTHSSMGPAPYDDAWAMLPDGANTPFFLSGKTYYGVMWTAPAGNAYYMLAHAYIAAQLNGLNGAGMSAVQSVFTRALTLLAATTPGEVAMDRVLRNQFVTMAGTLNSFNEGQIGPGHCSE